MTITPNRRPTHPGELLRHEIEDRKISIAALAESVEYSRKQLSLVINGHARIEPRLAGRLARVVGGSVELWLNMQAAVDAWDAREEAKGWHPSRARA